MTSSKTLYLKFTSSSGKYQLSWSHDPAAGYVDAGPTLIDPLQAIGIESRESLDQPVDYTLRGLIQALIGFKPSDLEIGFQERGQMALGSHLFRETIARIGHLHESRDVHARIEPPVGKSGPDDHLIRLPWPLLCRNGLYLSNADSRWSFSLRTQPSSLTDVELPPAPRMLVVTPEPRGVSKTQWGDHVEELAQDLRLYYPQVPADVRLTHVRTWEAFIQAVEETRYDLIYYYGHGEGDQLSSRLLFEDKDGTLVEKPCSSVADAICCRPVGERPVLIYVNCCQGDAGGLLGAGHQLSVAAPCIVTNRTVAIIDTAQRQARSFWKSVLKHATPPHEAASVLYQQPEAIGVSRDQVHWFTPVVHAHYDGWIAQPTAEQHDIPPDWNLKLDRVAQYSELTYWIRELRRERNQRAIAFIWFGAAGQGMRLFRERVEVKLHEDIGDERAKSWHPRWPDSVGHKDFRDIAAAEWKNCLTETFRVGRISDIAAQLRRDSQQERVAVLQFPHVDSSMLEHINPHQVRDYLRWWDDHVLHEIPDEDRLFVLTFSFETSDPDSFRKALEVDFGGQEFQRLMVRRLAPLGSVVIDDISDYLALYNVHVDDPRSQTIAEVLTETDGIYEPTLERLEQAVIDRSLRSKKPALPSVEPPVYR